MSIERPSSWYELPDEMSFEYWELIEKKRRQEEEFAEVFFDLSCN